MACWLMLGFFRALPEELEEAALIDGCTRWQAFLRIVLPLSRPALLAVTLFTLTGAWNELLFASVFVRSEALWTLPRGLSAMVDRGHLPLWPDVRGEPADGAPGHGAGRDRPTGDGQRADGGGSQGVRHTPVRFASARLADG